MRMLFLLCFVTLHSLAILKASALDQQLLSMQEFLAESKRLAAGKHIRSKSSPNDTNPHEMAGHERGRSLADLFKKTKPARK